MSTRSFNKERSASIPPNGATSTPSRPKIAANQDGDASNRSWRTERAAGQASVTLEAGRQEASVATGNVEVSGVFFNGDGGAVTIGLDAGALLLGSNAPGCIYSKLFIRRRPGRPPAANRIDAGLPHNIWAARLVSHLFTTGCPPWPSRPSLPGTKAP